MSGYTEGMIFALFLGFLFYGGIIAIIILVTVKIVKKIREKKLEKVWKVTAAREAAKEESDSAGGTSDVGDSTLKQ